MENKVTTIPNIKWKRILIPVIIVVVAIVLIANSIAVVDAGHTGVVVTMGKVNEGTLQEGLHFKIPFVQDVVIIDNRIRKLEVNTEAFSKDLQSVNTTLAINYRVDTAKSDSIYKNIGADYESVLVTPAVNEVLKAITATYTAEESVTNRQLISDGLVTGLNEKLNDIGLLRGVHHRDRREAGRPAEVAEGRDREEDRYHQRRSGGRGDQDQSRRRGRGERYHQQVPERDHHRE